MDNWTNRGLQITHLRYASDGDDESDESYGKDDRMFTLIPLIPLFELSSLSLSLLRGAQGINHCGVFAP